MKVGRVAAPRRASAALPAALLCLLLFATPSQAVVHPAVVVPAPANGVLEVDGAALAPDGSGGVVYRARGPEGIPHVYVEQLLNGAWSGPIQVDAADPYGASEPTIAAGDGGMLLVVWVQPRNVSPSGVTLYSLTAASDQPGAPGFGPPVTVDPNVGEPHNGDISAVIPQLAMDRASGEAYVVYRVATNDCNPVTGNDPPSSLCAVPHAQIAEVRVARFSSLPYWNVLGAVNRAPAQVAMRVATAENRPSIGVDEVSGNALVAWQEPDSSGVARIWARRVFGQTLGNVLAVSPSSLGGKPVTSDAEVPVVAVSPYGEARVAFRLDGAGATPARLYANDIASAFAFEASQFAGPVPIADLAGASTGVPGMAIDQRGNYRLVWTSTGTVFATDGTLRASGRPTAIAASAGPVATTVDAAGGNVTSWLSGDGGAGSVGVRQEYPDGGFQQAQLAGTLPGSIEGFSLAGSGQGDALLAWSAGQPGHSQVVADFVQAPPAPFNVIAPQGWVKPRRASLVWEPAPDAVAGVRYAVYADGRQRIAGLTGLSASLSGLHLGDGRHAIQVLATDAAGQETMSGQSELMIDGNPPIARARLEEGGHGVLVTVTDRASGVKRSATAISFGDGLTARRRTRVRHRYARAGTYTITARVRDNVGNAATERIRVRIT